MNRTDTIQLFILCLVLAAVLFGIAHTSWKIGERNLSAADEVEAFKAAVREEIEHRFHDEQKFAQVQRNEIHDEATEAKQIATKALTNPKALILTVKTPLPVIVTTTPTPSPSQPTPSPRPTTNTDPHQGGLLQFFR